MYHHQSECYSDSHPVDQGVFAAGFLRLVAQDEREDTVTGKSSKAGKGKSRDFADYIRSCLNVIGRTIWVRYGGPCTDDDAIVYYEQALPFLVELAILEQRTDKVRSITWASRNAPSLIQGRDHRGALANDADREWFAAQEETEIRARFDYSRCHHGRVNLPKGRDLGRALAIRVTEMRTANIRGVTPIDRTADELADDRRAADLARKQATRKPQESSPTRLKVWERLGIKPTKFKRLKREGRLPDWPDIPRGVDPEPYVLAWVALYRAMHDPVPVASPMAMAA